MPQPPLRIERTFGAPPGAVFDAWSSAEVLARWIHPGSDWTSEVEIDFRVGGALRVVMREPSGAAHSAGGRYIEIERPRRIAYTWTWDEDGIETQVEVDFEAADGATTVTLTHSGLPDEETLRAHGEGWGETLDNLGEEIASGRRERGGGARSGGAG